MDIAKYIASGVLELYVLDQLNPAERAEVEGYAQQYPEVRAELDAIEQALETYAVEQALSPASDTFKQINAKIDATEPVQVSDPNNASGNLRLWQLLAGLGLLGAVALGLLWRSSNERQQEQLNEYRNQLDTCAQQTETITTLRSQLAILRDNGSQQIALTGQAIAPGAQAAVFYNNISNTTYFDPVGLPPTPTDRQYQLWAIKDGQTISLGVFDVEPTTQDLLQVDYIAEVDAFAITLEPRGGSENPTLDQMYVLGNVG